MTGGDGGTGTSQCGDTAAHHQVDRLTEPPGPQSSYGGKYTDTIGHPHIQNQHQVIMVVGNITKHDFLNIYLKLTVTSSSNLLVYSK